MWRENSRQLQQQEQGEERGCNHRLNGDPIAQKSRPQQQQIAGSLRREIPAVLPKPAKHVALGIHQIVRRARGFLAAEDPLDVFDAADVVAREEPSKKGPEITAAGYGRYVVDL